MNFNISVYYSFIGSQNIKKILDLIKQYLFDVLKLLDTSLMMRTFLLFFELNFMENDLLGNILAK